MLYEFQWRNTRLLLSIAVSLTKGALPDAVARISTMYVLLLTRIRSVYFIQRYASHPCHVGSICAHLWTVMLHAAGTTQILSLQCLNSYRTQFLRQFFSHRLSLVTASSKPASLRPQHLPSFPTVTSQSLIYNFEPALSFFASSLRMRFKIFPLAFLGITSRNKTPPSNRLYLANLPSTH